MIKQLDNTSLDIVRIRDPATPEQRSEIIKCIQAIRASGSDMIGGQNRIIDRITDTYGNGFHDFTDQPSDEPLSLQLQEEYFIVLCIEDTIKRLAESGVLTEGEADGIIWTLRSGRVACAAGMVLNAIQKSNAKEGDADDNSGS